MELTPHYVFAGGFEDLDGWLHAHPHRPASFRKGEYLWRPGEPYHKVFYITEGFAETFMEHESGKRRILSFHAAGTVYPMFHYQHYKLEEGLLCRAMTHVRALEFSQEQFGAMFDESEELRRHVIDWFSSATNLLLYELGHQDQNDSYVKLCNLLYLLSTGGAPDSARMAPLTQEDLADILGISLNNVTRNLARLREAGIIQTGRREVRVIDSRALAALCSGETL